MAKEEVDETESGEEEEAEEEEERPKKKRKRAFAERPRGRPRRAHGSFAEPRLYSKGVPIGPNGTALEDVPMSIEDIERIGAFDEESARITENSRRVLSRKASGEADVKFNSDSRTKYFDIRKYHPGAIVAITQVYPVKNEALRPTSFAACPTYDALLGYVRDHYWKGDDAAYVWRAYTETKSALGIGRFEFAADPDWEPGGRREPQHQQQAPQQPQQQNPFQQFQQPYGMQIPGMPPMFFQQPQQQPAAPVAPPPGTDAVVAALMQNNAQLMQYILAMTGNQASVQTYLAGLPQVIEQKVKEATPPPAPVVAAPPPPTPVEQVQQASELVQTITRMGRQLAHTLQPQQVGEVEQTPPANGEDDFPLQVRRVGLMNVVAQDGKIVDNLALTIGANAGPVLGLVDNFFKRFSDSKKEATELEIKRIEAEERREQQKLVNLREAKKLKEELEAPQRFVPPEQPPERWTAPAWAADQKPSEPEPSTS